MAGEPEHRAVDVLSIPPELAAAIVAAQQSAGKVIRDGDGDKGAYTTADSIAASAGKALNAAGAAWVRVGVALGGPSMQDSDIGNQSYVGDLTQTWVIVHESGAALRGTSVMPVIVSRGRPHDKAVAASLTFDVGAVLRGAVCLDRESKKDAIDRREEEEGRTTTAQPRIPDLGQRCTGKAAPIANANKGYVEALAAHAGADPAEVWGWAVRESGIDCTKYAHELPLSAELTTADGLVVKAVLKLEAGRKGVDDGGPEDDPT